MGKLVLVRIDDRLIHGQVTTAWLRVYDANTIIISNERIANNPIYKNIFTVATVPGKEIFLLSPYETVELIKNSKSYDSFFIIVPSPCDIVEMMNLGQEIKKINVGGLQGRPNTKRLAKVVYATSEEQNAFLDLQARGVEMEVQMVPTDRISRLNLK